MKKVLVFTAFAVVFISSCKKGDDTISPNITMADIAGKYKITGELYTVTRSGVSNTQDTYNFTYPTDCSKNSTFTLGVTGSFVQRDSCYHLTLSGTYKLSGNRLYENNSYRYSVIESHNSTTLVLSKTDTTVASPLTIEVIKQTLTKL
jgi:hypothetical protein